MMCSTPQTWSALFKLDHHERTRPVGFVNIGIALRCGCYLSTESSELQFTGLGLSELRDRRSLLAAGDETDF
jgi:hypothetical protein